MTEQAKKLIFITEYPYSFNSNGAAALSSSHLRTLYQLRIFNEIIVIYLGSETNFWKDIPGDDLKTAVKVRIIFQEEPVPLQKMNLSGLALQHFKKNKFKDIALSIFDYSESQELLDQLQQVITEERPSYMWAEHLQPLLFLSHLDTGGIKIAYSHHDFLFKILKIKRGLLKDRIRSFYVRRLELLSLKKVDLFISGSLLEIAYAKKWMGIQNTLFLPCVYPPLPSFDSANSNTSDVARIVHFGTISATANKLGINNLFTKILPLIRHLNFELHFVGNVQEYIVENFPEALQQHKIFFHGFVANPADCFRPYDIHIIPYKEYSGTRTRVGSIIRYKPCIVGYINLLDNYPFLKNEENAFVASADQEIIDLLQSAITNNEKRMRTGNRIQHDMNEFEKKMALRVLDYFHPAAEVQAKKNIKYIS